MFPGVTVPQAEAGKAAAAGSILSGVGAIANPIAGGLALAGGLSGMFGSGGSGMDVSKAVSGGTFTTGDIGSGTGTTVVIVAAVLLGLFLILGKRK